MTAVRPDVAELLAAGYGDRTIARQLGVTANSVTRARTELGLPKARGGNKTAASAADLYWRRTRPAGDGHLDWAGHRTSKGTPTVNWGGHQHTAYRIAYRIATGQGPKGYVHAICDHAGCVAPAHMADNQTERRAHHPGSSIGRPPNASEADILALLKTGLSNREIIRRLNVGRKRIARVRSAAGLPDRVPPTVDGAWAAYTEPADGGHLAWTGPIREGIPVFGHGGRYHMARRVAFRIANGREPQGRVKAGCGWQPCVLPAHIEDQAMRDQFTALFGEVAA